MSGWKNRTRLCISRPTKLTAETGGAGSRSSDKTSPQLSRAGGEEFQRLAQRSLVFHVHALLRAVNLAHQPAQHFPRTNLDKSLCALSNQPLHGLAPSNRSCHLSHQSLPRAFWIFDRPGIHVGHHRKLRRRELQTLQNRRHSLLLRRLQRPMEFRADGGHFPPLPTPFLRQLHSPFNHISTPPH